MMLESVPSPYMKCYNLVCGHVYLFKNCVIYFILLCFNFHTNLDFIFLG
jgi:hypothetical protein